jgi:hypothetical protein
MGSDSHYMCLFNCGFSLRKGFERKFSELMGKFELLLVLEKKN